jgi:hypothetical protein
MLSLGPTSTGVTAPVKPGCAHCAAGHLDVLTSGIAQAGWKWPQVHWAQQRAGLRPMDSPHTGQSKALSSSASLPGAGAADAGMEI